MSKNITDENFDPRKQEEGKSQEVLSRKVFYKGDNIIEQGDEGIRAYYIENGSVEVLVEEDGHQLKVAELGAGDIFGEMALINKEVRSATVRALEDCTVTIISRDEIEGKIEGIVDKATRKLISVLAARLRNSTQGQIHHYKSLADFQDRVCGMVDRVHVGIDESKRTDFRDEVEPLLNDLQSVLDRYQR